MTSFDKYNCNTRLWSKIKNLISENIITKAKRSQTKVKNLTEILNEEYKNYKNLNYDKNLEIEEVNENEKLKKNLSPNVNKIINDVGKMLTNIKKSTEDLSKMNINSLLNTKTEIQKTEKMKETSVNFKIKEKEYQKALEGKIKRTPNYKFLSDGYRKELNKIILNFNPIKHLENMLIEKEKNNSTNKEYQDKKKSIEKDIKNFTSKNFYRNQYKKFQKMFKLNKNEKQYIDTDENKNEKNETKKNIKSLLPKIANNTTSGFYPNNFTTDGNLSNRMNKINHHKFRRKETKTILKKFPDKEGRKLELELLEDACQKILNSINYLDESEYNFYTKYSKLNKDERKIERNYYKKDKFNAENILIKIQRNNLMRHLGDNIDKKKEKINDNIKDYGKQIKIIKNEIIKDIEEQEVKGVTSPII